jgi:hypothetical protein
MGFGSYLVMILSLGSPLVLAKSYLFPLHVYRVWSDEAAGTHLDGNPFQIRNGIIQRYEQIAGMIWLAGAVVLSQPFMASWLSASLVGPWTDLFVALAGGAGAWLVTMMVIKWRSARVYRPRMIETHRGLFEEAATRLSRDGRTLEDVAVAAEYLDQIGKVLDRPRRADETAVQHAERLNPLFHPDAGLAHPRRCGRWRRAMRWLTRRAS